MAAFPGQTVGARPAVDWVSPHLFSPDPTLPSDMRLLDLVLLSPLCWFLKDIHFLGFCFMLPWTAVTSCWDKESSGYITAPFIPFPRQPLTDLESSHGLGR